MSREYSLYIMASRSRRLYVGVTRNLDRRAAQHRTASSLSFVGRYRINRLVYFESTPNIRAAIAREKQVKNWFRAKKVDLVEQWNPGWHDLAQDGSIPD